MYAQSRCKGTKKIRKKAIAVANYSLFTFHFLLLYIHLGKTEGLWFLSGERDGPDGVNAREIGEPVESVVIVVTVINPMQWASIREV